MITVVTVCKNVERIIEHTMHTVITQKDVEIEYIIKDGESVDATNAIIKAYIETNKKENIIYKHIISKDTGIYDAMNQAIALASGEWIIFMNAGDCFYNSNVLRDLSRHMTKNADVLYGNTLFVMNEKYCFPQIHDVSIINNHFNLGHQSCVVKTEVMKKNLYDVQYKIAGDYECLLRLFRSGKKFVHVNMIISMCNREGISNQKSNLQFNEVYKIQHVGILTKDGKYKKKLVMWEIKKIVAKIFPNWESYRYCQNNMKRIIPKYEDN